MKVNEQRDEHSEEYSAGLIHRAALPQHPRGC